MVQPLKAFPPKPDGQHSAGYWIADYIKQFAPAGRPVKLDYALITHFHTDHMGTITADKPLSKTGAYRLAGITEVGDLIPISTLIDRAAPNRSEEHTSELQSLMRISYAVFCLKKKRKIRHQYMISGS